MIRLYCFPGAADNYMLPVSGLVHSFHNIDGTMFMRVGDCPRNQLCIFVVVAKVICWNQISGTFMSLTVHSWYLFIIACAERPPARS